MKINTVLFVLCALLFISCNDDEQMQYAKIYFPLAAWTEKTIFLLLILIMRKIRPSLLARIVEGVSLFPKK